MENMYWIMTLTGVHTVFIILSIVFGILFFIYFIGFIMGTCEDDEDTVYATKKAIKYTLPVCIISILLSVFVPTTRQMLTILGVGGTYEYIKENDTAKQLPDKCIIALDKLMDEYINDEED